MSSTGRACFPVGRVIVGSSSSEVALAAGKACLSDIILDGKHKYHLDGRSKVCGRSHYTSSLSVNHLQLKINEY